MKLQGMDLVGGVGGFSGTLKYDGTGDRGGTGICIVGSWSREGSAPVMPEILAYLGELTTEERICLSGDFVHMLVRVPSEADPPHDGTFDFQDRRCWPTLVASEEPTLHQIKDELAEHLIRSLDIDVGGQLLELRGGLTWETIHGDLRTHARRSSR